MKDIYYYMRNEKGIPRVTVCLMQQDNAIARGISICSMKDVVDKKEGKRKARNKALKALGTMKNSEPVARLEAIRALQGIEIEREFMSDYSIDGYLYKSWYNPNLTAFEKLVIEKLQGGANARSGDN